jgi:hypothetical protein
VRVGHRARHGSEARNHCLPGVDLLDVDAERVPLRRA